METKKNAQVDLHKKRGLFFTIGLVFTCMFVISAFEWKTFTDQEKIELTAEVEDDTMLDVPVTQHKEPPPPAKIQQPEVVEIPDNQDDDPIDFEFIDLEDPVTVKVNVEMPKPKKPVKIIEEEIKDDFVLFSEVAAKPKDGYKAFYQYIADHLKYPSQARRMGVEGRVFIQFIIEKDGSLTDIKVIKGIGSGCDEEAIRVLQDAPKWSPGRQRGREVRVRKSIPILFKLR